MLMHDNCSQLVINYSTDQISNAGCHRRLSAMHAWIPDYLFAFSKQLCKQFVRNDGKGRRYERVEPGDEI